MKEKTPFFIILKDLANKFRGRFACLRLKQTSREIDPGYQVVFRASKFYKSLARWLVMQAAGCRTLLIIKSMHLINLHFWTYLIKRILLPLDVYLTICEVLSQYVSKNNDHQCTVIFQGRPGFENMVVWFVLQGRKTLDLDLLYTFILLSGWTSQ